MVSDKLQHIERFALITASVLPKIINENCLWCFLVATYLNLSFSWHLRVTLTLQMATDNVITNVLVGRSIVITGISYLLGQKPVISGIKSFCKGTENWQESNKPYFLSPQLLFSQEILESI